MEARGLTQNGSKVVPRARDTSITISKNELHATCFYCCKYCCTPEHFNVNGMSNVLKILHLHKALWESMLG